MEEEAEAVMEAVAEGCNRGGNRHSKQKLE
jgi:hypothetical protein